MSVTRIHSITELDSIHPVWNALADDNPFLQWEWLITWWKHYGTAHDLYVLLVRDEQGAVIGIAPWYREQRSTQGRVIQFLGSGKVCSDYLSLMCQPEHEDMVSRAVASWLSDINDSADAATHGWDLIELIGISADNSCIGALADALEERQLTVHRDVGVPCFRIELPDDWESYLRTISKGSRRRARKVLSALDDGSQTIEQVTSTDAFDAHWTIFQQLHQRRRHSIGETGCFDHPPCGTFLHDATRAMIQASRCRLVIAYTAGRPLAVEYLLCNQDTCYVYQSGLEPDFAQLSPGRLGIAYCIRDSIQRGLQVYDFLRGDEEYKTHWLARPCDMVEIRAVAPHRTARMRHQVWIAGHAVKDWVKGSLEMAGLR